MNRNDDTAAWVKQIIQDFILGSPDNILQGLFIEKAWERALVGFSSGNDPLYLEYKEKYIGRFHWTPFEAFNLAFPDARAQAGDLTVISWILPQTEATRADNRREKAFPAERWVRSRIFGEAFNDKLRLHVVESLALRGVKAVAPVLLTQWSRTESEQYGFASTWSERHAAYAAGLGTFGLCDGLITPFGKAVRFGSAVAHVEIPVTPRPYSDPHAYCLFYARGTCKKCVDRCPVGAISEAGHDKYKCDAHLRPATAEYARANYHLDGFGCGLCQTGVPCENRIPLKRDG
jgi:epoxyqueuosine reductase QueG